MGYGLVVGLGGTGDKKSSTFTISSMVNMLDKMGIAVDRTKLTPKNVAAVMVTTRMPVSAPSGFASGYYGIIAGRRHQSAGRRVVDDTHERGGRQGVCAGTGTACPGRFFGGRRCGAGAEEHHHRGPHSRRCRGVERAVPFEFNTQNKLTLHMNVQDFSTTMQVVDRLNDNMGGQFASARDIATVDIMVPPAYRGNLVPLMASLENLPVTPDSPARVVVDEKTGTVVVGNSVRISKVAVSHGNLQIVVQENPQVSQPRSLQSGADRGHSADGYSRTGREPAAGDDGRSHAAGTCGRPEFHRRHTARSYFHTAHAQGGGRAARGAGGHLA